MLPREAYPQLLRYFIAGVLNTVFAYIVYATAIFGGLHYAVAVFLGGVLPIFTGYHLQRRYVFMYAGGNRLARFFVSFVIVYLVNVAILKALLVIGLTGGLYLSGAVAMVPSVTLSFLLNRYLVFQYLPASQGLLMDKQSKF